jgi:hypothetical protein
MAGYLQNFTGIIFPDSTVQESGFTITDKQKLLPILNSSTSNRLDINQEMIITDGQNSAIFGPFGLYTTNPNGLQVQSPIDMNNNNIIRINNLELNNGNIIGVNTINGDNYPPPSTIPSLDIVLTEGNNAGGLGITNLLDLTFTNGLIITDQSNNAVIESTNNLILNTGVDLTIQSSNTEIVNFTPNSVNFSQQAIFNTYIPTCETAVAGDTSTQIATTEFVQNAINSGGTTGISIPFKISGTVGLNGTGSFWNFSILPTWGDGFMFTLYTETNPPSGFIDVNPGDNITLDGKSISSMGIATGQNYKVNDIIYYSYVLTLVSYTGIPSLNFNTTTDGSDPIYTLQCNGGNYFYDENINMIMIIYPSINVS